MRTAPRSAGDVRAATSLSRRSFLKTGFLGTLLAGGAAAPLLHPPASAAAPVTPPPVTDFTDPTYHFLNRLSWGVRPADLLRAQRIGTAAYLEEQLSPRFVAASARVSVPPVLNLPRAAIYRVYKQDPYTASYNGLVHGMISRATLSPAQLYERMVEFWSDHFNIASSDLEPEVVDWQRNVIRRYALGKFSDLLHASARHPAMLYYLDNANSDKDHPNENYARELMELHTLGVDGGYTEADVKNVARAFTGWTADYHGYSGFVFDPDLHDADPKTVLGQAVSVSDGPNGVNEGTQVLDRLAAHLNTATFLCKKLCRRFISDAYAKPGDPENLVIAALAAVWTSSNGDIKTVLRALFNSDAFKASAQQKLRRPLDFQIAALRATGTVYLNFNEQEYHAELLDQVPYNWGPPDGYPDVAAAWATTSGLFARWSVAQTLTDGALPASRSRDVRSFFQRRLAGVHTVGALVDRLSSIFLAIQLPTEARASVIAFATDSAGGADTPLTPDLMQTKLGTVAGLILSIPQFQWR